MFGINERLDNILTGLSSIKKKKKLEGEFLNLQVKLKWVNFLNV